MAHKKIPTRANDKKGKPIFEGDTIMAGSPPMFITVEWQEVKCKDETIGDGTMCGFFIPDDCTLLIGNEHPGFEEPSKS